MKERIDKFISTGGQIVRIDSLSFLDNNSWTMPIIAGVEGDSEPPFYRLYGSRNRPLTSYAWVFPNGTLIVRCDRNVMHGITYVGENFVSTIQEDDMVRNLSRSSLMCYVGFPEPLPAVRPDHYTTGFLCSLDNIIGKL